MGRRTHKKEIPADAMDYKGKPWTRLMIIEYCGITPYQYTQYTKDRSPLNLLEWGAQIIREKRRAVKNDLSRVVTLNGISLTIMQWFYFTTKQRLDIFRPYRSFAGRINQYKARQNMTRGEAADQSALADALRSMGIEGLPTWIKRSIEKNPDYLEKQLDGYLEKLDEYHQKLKDNERDLLKEPERANDRWFECLLADTRLHWLFVEEFDKQMADMQSSLDFMRKCNVQLQADLDKAHVRIREQERQLADFRRINAVKDRT